MQKKKNKIKKNRDLLPIHGLDRKLFIDMQNFSLQLHNNNNNNPFYF